MIAVCCDHGGLSLKKEVLRHLEEKGLEYKDFGTNSPESCDYPDIVKPLCQAIQRGECDKGVIICGTGIGISMAANKMKGIRAASATTAFPPNLPAVTTTPTSLPSAHGSSAPD